MIARIHKSTQEKDKGFTLIELLVVMIIIGILAAIAIPIFLNQRKKAQDTAATSDVSTLGKEVATYYVDATSVLGGVSGGTFNISPYSLGTLTNIGNTSKGVTGAKLTYGAYGSAGATVPTSATDVTNASTSWCVEVDYSGGTRSTVYYSAADGLQTTGC